MRLTALDVRDLRIIERAALEPGQVNLVIGHNAAGKTSLLESIHLLGSGRSFSPTRPDRLIRNGGGPLRVVARMRSHDGAGEHRLGVERTPGGPWNMRLDGRQVERVADLARMIPVVAIHPASHELLAGVPAERRGMIDWGLFHVEPSFHDAWRRYRRALTQRNALLRREAHTRELAAWIPELADAGARIDTMRQAYVVRLADVVRQRAGDILRDAADIELSYRRGWDEESSLASLLESRLPVDRRMRTTTAGPHRAELQVRLDGRDSRQRVSRGQQKLLVYLLRLAQAVDLGRESGHSPVLLLDDPAAELDRDHRRRILAASVASGAQIFIASIEREGLELPASPEPKVFHVEQGRVREVIQ